MPLVHYKCLIYSIKSNGDSQPYISNIGRFFKIFNLYVVLDSWVVQIDTKVSRLFAHFKKMRGEKLALAVEISINITTA